MKFGGKKGVILQRKTDKSEDKTENKCKILTVEDGWECC